MINLNREYMSLSKLDHPYIAELLEVYKDPNFIYFVHPFYTGGEIHDLMYSDEELENNNEEAQT